MKVGRRFGGGGSRGVVEQDSLRPDMAVLIDGVPVRPVLTVRTTVATRTVLEVDVTFGSDDAIPID